MTSYLITGGTGLIGRALCKKLNASGHSIIVLSRQSSKDVKSLCGEQVTAVRSLSEIDRNTHIDIVINLAGEPIASRRWTAKRKQLLESSRIELTQILVQWLSSRTHKPKKLISGSAIGWYGNMGDQTLTEHSTYHDEYTHQLCDKWEQAALDAEQLNIPVCIIRTGLVLSNNGGVLKQMLLPFKLGLGGRISNGQQYMSWIHIDDEVNLILYLANTPAASGIYNATAPQPVTNQDFSKSLAKSLNRPCLFITPAWPLRLILGELARLLVTGQRVTPEKAQAEGFKFHYTNLQNALNQLLHKQTTP
jgi:hypothetical protein